MIVVVAWFFECIPIVTSLDDVAFVLLLFLWPLLYHLFFILQQINVSDKLCFFTFCSKTFVDALRRVGAEAELILYDGKTHTDLILQVRDLNSFFLFVSSCNYLIFGLKM